MKVMTKGVRKHRKWLKHLWGEGKRIVYKEGTAIDAMDAKGKPMFQAYIERYPFPKNHKPLRLVPGRMAEQVWLLRRDQ